MVTVCVHIIVDIGILERRKLACKIAVDLLVTILMPLAVGYKPRPCREQVFFNQLHCFHERFLF